MRPPVGGLHNKFLRKVANKQTNKQRRKNILLGGGNKQLQYKPEGRIVAVYSVKP